MNSNRTGRSFGYLWSRFSDRREIPSSYHYQRMREALPLPPLRGVVLDAGCGEGIDLLNAARSSEARVIGVELSEGGARSCRRRTTGQPNAQVVQADLNRLPFSEETFDFIYSYGVLHHLDRPARGMSELVRVLKPGAQVAVYLYEDFSDRRGLWKILLAAANGLRGITTRLPHPLLFLLCAAASPVVWLLFTVPYLLLKRLPGRKRIAETFPFRHGKGPFSLTGDLFDRFGAPVERRFSRHQTEQLLREAGLEKISVGKNRGWVALGAKQ